MALLDISSQVTFLYFDDFPAAKAFFSEVLELSVVHDPGWAIVYQTAGRAFLGAVDAKDGSIPVDSRGGVLISLTVNNIEETHRRLKEKGLAVAPIKHIKGIAMRSFLFKGPEGYDVEIQQFDSKELQAIY